MNLLDYSKMDGVKDLPMPVRAKFAHALMAEAEGNTEEAYAFLLEAVAEEERINSK